MQILFYIFLGMQAILALYLLLPAILLLIHFLRRLFFPYRSPLTKKPRLEKDFDFAAIVTAHQDTRFILPLVDSLLKQKYQRLHIYIVADACDITDLHFNDSRVTLLKP